MLRWTLRIKLALVLVLLLGAGFLYLRLESGPLSFGRLPDRFAVALATRIGPGWSVAIRNTAFELEGAELSVRATGLDIRNPDGALVVRAPEAIMRVAALPLLTASIQPRSMEFRDLQLRAVVNPDGAITFVPSAEGEEAPAIPVAARVATASGASPVSVAVGSLLRMLVGQSGVLGALDEARATNARLTLVDGEGVERARFRRVDAVFERTATDGRRFNVALDGPGGVWRVEGEAVPEQGGYRAAVATADAPLQDLVLLSGLSALPATFDLKVSGTANANITAERLTKLDVQLAAQSGTVQIHDKDTSPLVVEEARLQGAWDEQRRVLALPVLSFKGGGSQVLLQGELAAMPVDAAWRLAVAGNNATLAGVTAADAPVVLDRIEAQIAEREGLIFEKLAFAGSTVKADLTGAYGTLGDPRSLAVSGRAMESDVRSVLRLWPEAVAPAVRRYLAANLKAGTVELLDLDVRMSGADMTQATGDGPLPTDAVRLAFAMRGAELVPTEGLPPLMQGNVSGSVSGIAARVLVPAARVSLADGRSLAARDGSVVVENFWGPDSTAQIALRLEGGADGVGALLQAPLLREMVGLDLDPAGIKGRGDLRVQVALPVKNIPEAADMPVTVTGTVSDLSIEKMVGKDRLEGANLTVAYDRGALTIKGEGKLGGTQGNIDVRRAKGQPGEAVLSMVMDEAARSRRGLSFGSQLTGPISVKAAMPLGSAKAATRFEVDLARATIDQAIPGWAKAAGRPAKLTFALADHGSGSEVRDIVLESGSVNIRGSAVLSADGQLDKAELTTFKLSPGDDMRAQVERSGSTHKVTVRGNVGDARPFTKQLAPGSPVVARVQNREARDARDIDLDLALNILTGYNDEAITSASVKASLRQENLRALQLSGRLGSSTLSGRTVARAGTVSTIVFQADDAGRLMRFLDVYRRMEGGVLHVQIGAGEGAQPGFLTLNNFTVRNEPALSRIIPTQSRVVRTEDSAGRSKTATIDVNQVHFSKARVEFLRSAARLDFKDAAIFGTEVGFTLGGYVDYARDYTDISGTFVPAYGVNNAIAQVPLFGPLLSGGRYEGLFAVNFRVSGPASGPSLSVNPLSAVAPGFLRKLFGAGAAQSEADAPAPTHDR